MKQEKPILRGISATRVYPTIIEDQIVAKLERFANESRVLFTDE
jgi:hypothetical protein